MLLIALSSGQLWIKEGDNATVLWKIDHYDRSSVFITNQAGKDIIRFIFGNVNILHPDFDAAGDGHSTFGFFLSNVTERFEGIYYLQYGNEIFNCTLRILGNE